MNGYDGVAERSPDWLHTRFHPRQNVSHALWVEVTDGWSRPAETALAGLANGLACDTIARYLQSDYHSIIGLNNAGKI
ncbi:hypothetical protein J6590_017263 [Homalodisca vitripennis]|nr:hypothetical protein J6590_017263 [Homalodisca vitripennis]